MTNTGTPRIRLEEDEDVDLCNGCWYHSCIYETDEWKGRGDKPDVCPAGKYVSRYVKKRKPFQPIDPNSLRFYADQLAFCSNGDKVEIDAEVLQSLVCEVIRWRKIADE